MKKKETFKRMKKKSSRGAIQDYRKSKRKVKRVVAVAKAKSTEKWYNELETKRAKTRYSELPRQEM